MMFFSKDIFYEIFTSLKCNKLRTALTGLSISWGIFILIVLIGAGNGLRNGVMSNFNSRAINRVSIYSSTTSKPYNGLKSGRMIWFTDSDIEYISKTFTECDLISPLIRRNFTLLYDGEYGDYRVNGVAPIYSDIYKFAFRQGEGRFINHRDIEDNNKVVVIDKEIEDILFKGRSAIGKTIRIGDVVFAVIGVNSKKEQWGTTSAYIPYSTYQTIFNGTKSVKKINQIIMTVNGLDTEAKNSDFSKRLRKALAERHGFDPDDNEAIWINNSQQEYLQAVTAFSALSIVVSVIGLLTLIAGIVGVSNIMLVSVKERTREIGIRKAIGASPASILKSIILESVIITLIFGYIGMILGIGLTEGANLFLEKIAADKIAAGGAEFSVFKDPTVGLGYAIFSTAILIGAGVISGYMPARKAVRVKPIEAMRQE